MRVLPPIISPLSTALEGHQPYPPQSTSKHGTARDFSVSFDWTAILPALSISLGYKSNSMFCRFLSITVTVSDHVKVDSLRVGDLHCILLCSSCGACRLEFEQRVAELSEFECVTSPLRGVIRPR